MADDNELSEDALEDVDPDAEGEEGEEGEGGGKKKGKKKKLLIIIILAVLLLVGAGAGLYFSGIIGGGGEISPEASTDAAMQKATEKHYFALPEFLVNLNTSARQSSFLKMTIILELVNPKDEALIEANMPRITDSFNTYLRELRPSDLYGSAGLYRLREELLDRVNKIIAPAAVNDILFKQVLIQ